MKKKMSWFELLFPVFASIKDPMRNSVDEISDNNYRLAQELEGKGPMSAQQIKQYVKDKDNV